MITSQSYVVPMITQSFFLQLTMDRSFILSAFSLYLSKKNLFQWCNKSIISQACLGLFWKNISHSSFLYVFSGCLLPEIFLNVFIIVIYYHRNFWNQKIYIPVPHDYLCEQFKPGFGVQISCIYCIFVHSNIGLKPLFIVSEVNTGQVY